MKQKIFKEIKHPKKLDMNINCNNTLLGEKHNRPENSQSSNPSSSKNSNKKKDYLFLYFYDISIPIHHITSTKKCSKIKCVQVPTKKLF